MAISVPPKGDNDKRIGAYFAPLLVEAQTIPSMTVKVRPGGFWTNMGEYREFAGGNTPAIAPPTANAKWVVVALNENASLQLYNGTPSANPQLPTIPTNVLPLAGIFVGDTATAITSDMVFDIRPQWSIRPENIPDLAGELAARPTVTDVNNMLASKADIDGTPSLTFTLNADHVGVAGSSAELIVNRGAEPDVSIKWDESLEKWTFSNDGVTWNEMGVSTGSYYTKVELDSGALDFRYYEQAQLDSGVLDTRYYTEAEVNANFALISHTHTASQILDLNTQIVALAPVKSVAGKTGIVTLVEADITNLNKYARVPGAITGRLVGFGAGDTLVDTGVVAANVSTTGHTHTSANITDFNVAVAGVLNTTSIDAFIDVVSNAPAQGHVLVYQAAGSRYENKPLALDDFGDVIISSPMAKHVLVYDTVDSAFKNRLLVKTDISDFVENDYVLTGGSVPQAITGDKTFVNNVTIQGNLNVLGTFTTVSSVNVEVTDNIMILNSGESGAGVSAGNAGIEIDRGTLSNALLVWDEVNGRWRAGTVGNMLGISRDGHAHLVADITDLSASATELNYTDGVTAPIQTQIDGKISRAGDAMNPAANLLFSAGGQVLGLPATPTAPDAAASKAYVDVTALALATHVADDTVHLTAAQNTLLDGLAPTLTAAELNYVDGVTSGIQGQIDATNLALSTHVADDTVHLTASQNTLLDGLAPTLTAAELNYVDGVTSPIQGQIDATNLALSTHVADDTVHLTAAQNTLLDGLAPTLTATELNYVDGVTSPIQTQLNTLDTTLSTHMSDDTRHLTALQDAFIDGLNLPTLTSTEVNYLIGVTSGVQGQFNTLTSNLATHVADGAVHLTAAQNTLLDGLAPTLTAAELNYVDGVTSGIQGQIDATNLALSTHVADDAVHLTASQNTLLDGLAPALISDEISALVGVHTYETVQTQIDSKMDRVAGPTAGNLVILTIDGHVADALITPSAFALAIHTHQTTDIVDFVPDVNTLIANHTGPLLTVLDDLNDVTIAGAPVVGNVLRHNGSVWTNTPLVKAAIIDWVESDFVHAQGNLAESITGNKTFANDVTINGDLTVAGTTTWVNSTNLTVTDKNIVLNSGYAGPPTGANGAGITVIRNLAIDPTANLLWDEVQQQWKGGLAGSEAVFTVVGHTHVSTSITDFTEAAQDAVGAAITAGTKTNITVTYDDANNKVDFTVNRNSFHPDYELVVGTGLATYLTAFNFTAPVAGKVAVQVFVNGIKQVPGAAKAYTVTAPNTITFNAGSIPAVGDDVEFYGFG